MAVMASALTLGSLALAAPAVLAMQPAGDVAPYPIRDLGTPTVFLDGKPIWGTLENLPGMGATSITSAGPALGPTIEAYYSPSGGRSADLEDMRKKAINLLRSRLHTECDGDAHTCKAMVVFDIDETLLDNYSYWSAQDPAFTLNYTTWATYVDECRASVITQVRKVYRQAQDMGVQIALITSRTDSQRQATRRCLKERGITGWDALITKPDASTLTASVYKAQARKQLEKQGYTILASVGDQLSDMAGGYLTGGIWLPNPIYYVP